MGNENKKAQEELQEALEGLINDSMPAQVAKSILETGCCGECREGREENCEGKKDDV